MLVMASQMAVRHAWKASAYSANSLAFVLVQTRCVAAEVHNLKRKRCDCKDATKLSM